MKKVLLFLSVFILLLAMCSMLYLSGAIYDTAGKATVVPYFFQPNNQFDRRLGEPSSPNDLESESPQESEMYRRLVERYITEMFYVTPDVTELKKRTEGQTALYLLSRGGDAFSKWSRTIAPEVIELTNQRKLRLVKVLDMIPEERYIKVIYELKTWNETNNMEISPEISYGSIYLNVRYEPGMLQLIRKRPVEEYLENGGDPAAIFRFRVLDITTP